MTFAKCLMFLCAQCIYYISILNNNIHSCIDYSLFIKFNIIIIYYNQQTKNECNLSSTI